MNPTAARTLQIEAENNALRATLKTACALMTKPQIEATATLVGAMLEDVNQAIKAPRPNDGPPVANAKEVLDAATARAYAEILQLLGQLPN